MNSRYAPNLSKFKILELVVEYGRSEDRRVDKEECAPRTRENLEPLTDLRYSAFQAVSVVLCTQRESNRDAIRGICLSVIANLRASATAL